MKKTRTKQLDVDLYERLKHSFASKNKTRRVNVQDNKESLYNTSLHACVYLYLLRIKIKSMCDRGTKGTTTKKNNSV